MRPNSSPYTTCLTILPNEVQQSTLSYFSDHKMRPNNLPTFRTILPMRSNTSPYNTFLSILPNKAQQLTLYYLSYHTPESGPTVRPIQYAHELCTAKELCLSNFRLMCLSGFSLHAQNVQLISDPHSRKSRQPVNAQTKFFRRTKFVRVL